jgi:hypothetical protein
MSLTRAALVTAVAGELSQVLTLAGLGNTDVSGALKEPLDKVFRALGTAEASLASGAAADGAEQQAVAYAVYFALARATEALASKMDVSAGSASAKLRQQFENVRDRMKEALAIAQSYGLPVYTDGRGLAPMPFAGGISRAARETVIADIDREAPLFSSDALIVPGVDPMVDPATLAGLLP